MGKPYAFQWETDPYVGFVDFRTMTMTTGRRGNVAITWQLRRKAANEWEAKIQRSAREAVLEQLQTEWTEKHARNAATAMLGSLQSEAAFLEFHGPPEDWETLLQDEVPALETAYQRYVHSK